MSFTYDDAVLIYQQARNPNYRRPAMSKQLPPDPDGMNDARAAWAGQSINLMSTLTGCEPGQEALGDLLCNIFHWGDRNGIAPDEMMNIVNEKLQMYRDETTDC